MKKIVLTAPMLAVLTSLAGDASAATVEYNGAYCTAATPTYASHMDVNQYGPTNTTAGGPIWVTCPASTSGFANGRVGITAYDRNSEPLIDPSDANVVCNAYTLSAAGLIQSSLGTAVQTVGNNAAAQTHVSTTSLSFFTGSTVQLQCKIPSSTGSGFSHLPSYRIISP